MNLEEEIAAKIREVDGNHTMGASALSTALMPLVERAQAEATAQTLRVLSEKYEGFATRADEPMVRGTYRVVAALMDAEAAEIAVESEVSGV